MAEGRCSKHRKVQSILHSGCISIDALASLLKKLDVPVAGKSKLVAANRLIFDRVRRSIDVELQGGGEPFAWEIAEPALLLQEMVGASRELQELFAISARDTPCSHDRPWHMIIGMDEFTTGDKKKPKNRRKTMVVSYNFMELGANALCHEMSWMTFALCRSHIIGRAVGGWPRLFKQLLHMLLLGDLSFLKAHIVGH